MIEKPSRDLLREWERILIAAGLSIEKGRSSKLIYGTDFDRQDYQTFGCGGGRRIKPKATLSQIERDRNDD